MCGTMCSIRNVMLIILTRGSELEAQVASVQEYVALCITDDLSMLLCSWLHAEHFLYAHVASECCYVLSSTSVK